MKLDQFKFPTQFKPAQSFLDKCREYRRVNSIISYFCGLYSVEVSLQLISNATTGASIKDELTQLIAYLEFVKQKILKSKEKETVDDPSASRKYLVDFVQDRYIQVLNELHNGGINGKTVDKLIDVVVLYEVVRGLFPYSETDMDKRTEEDITQSEPDTPADEQKEISSIDAEKMISDLENDTELKGLEKVNNEFDSELQNLDLVSTDKSLGDVLDAFDNGETVNVAEKKSNEGDENDNVDEKQSDIESVTDSGDKNAEDITQLNDSSAENSVPPQNENSVPPQNEISDNEITSRIGFLKDTTREIINCFKKGVDPNTVIKVDLKEENQIPVSNKEIEEMLKLVMELPDDEEEYIDEETDYTTMPKSAKESLFPEIPKTMPNKENEIVEDVHEDGDESNDEIQTNDIQNEEEEGTTESPASFIAAEIGKTRSPEIVQPHINPPKPITKQAIAKMMETEELLASAQKCAKFAISSLNYEDADTALKELLEAVELVKEYKGRFDDTF